MKNAKAYYTNSDCNVADFDKLCSQTLEASSLKFTDNVTSNVPIYDASELMPILGHGEKRTELLAEWSAVLGQTSGVLAIKNAVTDIEALDAASAAFERIIATERTHSSGADHFAASGANDRVWNSLEKLCLEEPEIFARVFANPAIDAVAEAWLGKAYQMTSQVNLVRPGGKAQTAHRDYHLGFMSAEQSASYPKHVHDVSQVLTLQGAVAHCNVPIESGPTKLLPFSQSYGPGYLAYHNQEFRDYFEQNYVQLPLEKGDAVFFNPALFHGAGDNVSEDINRMVNLLQVSSCMGRAMETVDRDAMVRALYPVLKKCDLTEAERAAVIAASAEGYPFPTNLDTDPPVDGLAPQSQADLMREMLNGAKSLDAFCAALDAQNTRRKS